MNEGTMPAIAHIMEQKQNKQNKQPPPTPEKNKTTITMKLWYVYTEIDSESCILWTRDFLNGNSVLWISNEMQYAFWKAISFKRLPVYMKYPPLFITIIIKELLMLYCHYFDLSYALLAFITVKGPRLCHPRRTNMWREDSFFLVELTVNDHTKKKDGTSNWEMAMSSYVKLSLFHKLHCMQQQSASQIQNIIGKISNLIYSSVREHGWNINYVKWEDLHSWDKDLHSRFMISNKDLLKYLERCTGSSDMQCLLLELGNLKWEEWICNC